MINHAPDGYRCFVASHRGFTLIELLVVISIIALLIGILLPALQGARDAGQAVQCSSRLRQIGVSSAIYANDYNDFIPLGGLNSDGGFYRTGGLFRLGYIAEPSMWTCPSDTTRRGGTVYGTDDFYHYWYEPDEEKYPPGYMWNASLGVWSSTSKDWLYSTKGWRFSDLHSPTEDIFAGDAETQLHTNRFYYKSDWMSQYGVLNYVDFERHIQTINFLFADGHVSRWDIQAFDAWYNTGQWDFR